MNELHNTHFTERTIDLDRAPEVTRDMHKQIKAEENKRNSETSTPGIKAACPPAAREWRREVPEREASWQEAERWLPG